MIKKLQEALPKKCHVYSSEANFLMVDLGNIDSTKLAIELLNKKIFIKDLKTKDAFKNKNFIRLAVRTDKENDKLIHDIVSTLNI
jgi:histidinol-phosphate/aromatic aminotransferase/cobyric acid decarboxylase-like protein